VGSVIFTNNALTKMRTLQLSESHVLDAYNKGTVEKWTNGAGYNSVKKYNGYEIGVAWARDAKGVYRITSVWTRYNRR
jgi:hypothetical protein